MVYKVKSKLTSHVLVEAWQKIKHHYNEISRLNFSLKKNYRFYSKARVKTIKLH